MADMHIGYLIKQVFLMNQARLNTIFAEFDLTASQNFTLIYLFKAHERGEQVHQKDIEDAMDISNPSVTGILNRLEHKGPVSYTHLNYNYYPICRNACDCAYELSFHKAVSEV